MIPSFECQLTMPSHNDSSSNGSSWWTRG